MSGFASLGDQFCRALCSEEPFALRQTRLTGFRPVTSQANITSAKHSAHASLFRRFCPNRAVFSLTNLSDRKREKEDESEMYPTTTQLINGGHSFAIVILMLNLHQKSWTCPADQ